jgi:aspartyl-tRNA(Asn)/glutamyl-tRNA(Gln) amidotransferase subunit A
VTLRVRHFRVRPETRRLLEAGFLIPATRYLAAQQARRLLIDDVATTMAGVDGLLAPATPVTAPPRDASAVLVGGEPRDVTAALLSCALPISQLGRSALSVPIGSDDGMPFACSWSAVRSTSSGSSASRA